VASGDAHTRDSNPVACLCVVRNFVRSRFTPHWPAGPRTLSTKMIRSNRKFDSHSREPRSWRTIITG